MSRYTGPTRPRLSPPRHQHLGHHGRDQGPRQASVPARRARPHPSPWQRQRVPAAAPGEAEGPLHLRPDREAVPQPLRRGQPSARASPARTCSASSSCASTTSCTAPAGRATRPQARQFVEPRPRRRQRQAGRHPELPGAQGRRRSRLVDKAREMIIVQPQHGHARPHAAAVARDRRRRWPGHRARTARCASRSTCPCASSSSSSSTPSSRLASPPASGAGNRTRSERKRTCWSFSAPPSRPSARRRATVSGSPSARSSPASATRSATPCAAPCCRRSPAPPSRQVRFDDALHEFDTITGVTEDVTDIILNLKDIVVTSYSRRARRPCASTCAARPRSPPPTSRPTADVEILNPDLHIATAQRARAAWRSTSPSSRAGATLRRPATRPRPPSASSRSTPSSRRCAG